VFVVNSVFLSDNDGNEIVITAPTGTPKAVIINVLVLPGGLTLQTMVMNNGPAIQAITIWNFLSQGNLNPIRLEVFWEGSILWISNVGVPVEIANVSGSIGGQFVNALFNAIPVVAFPTSTVCVETF
jgi:hypothetical protein